MVRRSTTSRKRRFVGAQLAHGEASGGQPAHDVVDMAAVEGLQNHVQIGLLDRQARERSLVEDIDDVGICIANKTGDLGQSARGVRDCDAQAHHAAVPHQAAIDDR